MKPTAAKGDPAFDRLVVHGLERETGTSGQACPDADLLAAWFDRSLSPAEASRIEAHAAGCGPCQHVLADLARSEPEQIRAAPQPVPTRPWLWHWRWVVPAAALATAGVLLVVALKPAASPARETMQVARAQGEAPAVPAERGGPALEPPAQAGQPAAAPLPGSSSGEARSARAHPPATPLRPVEPAAPQPAPVGETANAAPASPPPPDRAAARPAPAGQARADLPKAGVVTESQPAPRVVAAQPSEERAEAAGAAAAPTAAQSVGVRKMATYTQLASNLVVGGAGGARGQKPALWRFGSGGLVERSEDGGQTWERQPTGVDGALLAGSAPSPLACWLVGAGGLILRSVDGKSWQRVPSPTTADLVSVTAWNPTSARVTTADHADYTTTDGGVTWRRR